MLFCVCYNLFMEVSLLNIKNRFEFRSWLEENHKTAAECWLAVKRGLPKEDGTFWYIDAVEEALCFGWIDSTVKKIDGKITAQRFAPRRKGSVWSELNKERCRRMEKLGLMTPSGRAALPDMSTGGFTPAAEIVRALQANKKAWDNFIKLPPLYICVRIDTIQIKKRFPTLFKSRLAKFVKNTADGVMCGNWNDYGRLPG